MAQLLLQIDPALLRAHPDHVAGQIVTVVGDDFPVSVENRRTFALVSCPGASVEETRALFADATFDVALIHPETQDRIDVMRAARIACRDEAQAAAHAAAVPMSASDLTTRDLIERIAAAALEADARGDTATRDALDAEQDVILATSRAAFREVEDAALADLPLPDPLVLTLDELKGAVIR